MSAFLNHRRERLCAAFLESRNKKTRRSGFFISYYN